MFPIKDNIKSARFPFFNILIILITIYVFIRQITAPDPDAFIQTYALIPSNIHLANPATLFPFVTAIFLHGSLLHILSNLVFLWVFGDNVEGHFPPFVYPLFYLATGVIGNITQYLLGPTSAIPIIGASGAIAGVLGAYFVLFPSAKVKTFVPIFFFFTFINLSASFLLGYWFVLQLISGAVSLPFTGEQGGVAFFAHIGGFLAGFVFAKIYKKESTQVLEGEIVRE